MLDERKEEDESFIYYSHLVRGNLRTNLSRHVGNPGAMRKKFNDLYVYSRIM